MSEPTTKAGRRDAFAAGWNAAVRALDAVEAIPLRSGGSKLPIVRGDDPIFDRLRAALGDTPRDAGEARPLDRVVHVDEHGHPSIRVVGGPSPSGSIDVERELAIREHLRATRTCIPPHASLDDLLNGDATIEEVRERQGRAAYEADRNTGDTPT